MKQYTISVYTTYDREDGFNVWVNANSDAEAFDLVRQEHWGVTNLNIISVRNV